MDFKRLVENNYVKIKAIVKYNAYKFYINEKDLLGIVNLKLATKINTDNNDYDLKVFLNIVNNIVTNAAIDVKRSFHVKNVVTENDDFLTVCDSLNKSYQPDFQLKEFINKICNDLSNYTIVKEVFEGYFLMGIESLELSKQLDMNHSTLRKRVLQIRDYVNKKYKNQYQELIS